MYICKEKCGEIFIIAVYVDDILLAGKTDQKINEVKQALAELFKMKDMGELHHFLGVKVVQKPSSKEVWIGQEAYTKNMLEIFSMESSKPVNTPINPGTKLSKGTAESQCVDKLTFNRPSSSVPFYCFFVCVANTIFLAMHNLF